MASAKIPVELVVTASFANDRLDRIENKLNFLIRMGLQSIERDMNLMVDFSEVQADVQGQTAVVQSAVVLLNGIADKIDAAVAEDDLGDQSAAAQLAADIRANTQTLAAAVEANTPAVAAPPVEPVPGETPVEPAPPSEGVVVE